MTAVEVSIIIPVVNGGAFVEKTVDAVLSWLAAQNFSSELIMVNDGSTDATGELLKKPLSTNPNYRVVTIPHNKGKGAALRSGLRIATGRFQAYTDADLPYGIEILAGMLLVFQGDSELALVYGSRSHSASHEKRGYGFMRTLGRTFFSHLTRLLVIPDVPDTQCGIKMFRRDVGALIDRHSRINRFAFDIELFTIVKNNCLKYQDFPVELNNRKESSVRLIKDTAQMIIDMLRIKWKAWRGEYTK